MTARTGFEGIPVALIGGAAIWGASLVPPPPQGETWAGIVPMVMAIALTLCGLWIAAGEIKAYLRNKGQERSRPNATALKVPGLFALSILYQQAMVYFGYLLPTAIIAPTVLYLFGVRSKTGLALSVVLCPLLFHLLFFELLGVFPPFGEMFDPLDLIRG